MAALLGSSLSHLEIGKNALKFIMWGNIIFKNIFWYVWEYALDFSACGYTLALLLLSSLLHLLIQISALISSAFGKILAVLLRSSLLHLKIETHALKFSSYKLFYSKF